MSNQIKVVHVFITIIVVKHPIAVKMLMATENADDDVRELNHDVTENVIEITMEILMTGDFIRS